MSIKNVTADANLTSLLESFEIKISSVLENEKPKTIERVAELKPNSVALIQSPPNVKQINDKNRRVEDDSMMLIVAAVPETGDSLNGRIENYFTNIDGVLNHIGLKADVNVVYFRRLGKSTSQSGERRKCRQLQRIVGVLTSYLGVLH